MKGYLLSIEIREGDLVSNEVGDIVLLEQAWCHDLASVAHEFSAPRLAAWRFMEAVAFARERGKEIVGHNNVAADPRATS